MPNLPVREMVLYKHGVGFFVRQGEVEASEVTLGFRQDEINDVLKSLAVFDQSGGQVLGVHYPTPMDRDDRLANSSIRLSDAGSLRDLLRDLRGRRAALVVEVAPGSTETVVGRVIGVDDMGNERARQGSNLGMMISIDSIAPPMIALLTDDNETRLYPLAALRGLRIEDSLAAQDLSYFLDTAQSEDARRTVTLRLSEGAHDLVVYYVAPSPTWRVSYRLVAESDENAETGKALLQGWGLFDNRLEEDLDSVRVTLVAGQPISFIYDLYASRIPQRPTVKDESRVAPGPIEYAGEVADWAGGADADNAFERALTKAAAASRSAALGLVAPAAAPPPAPAPQMRRDAMMQSTAVSAETKEGGEFFQYIVNTPVTVRRGESALVPIIGAEIGYQRELLYNGSKLPGHPVAALRFMNTTGLTLERGPVTVVENGDYKGEAVVPFTKDGNPVYVPYAVELGVSVTVRSERFTETNRLSIQGAYLLHDEYQGNKVTYILENTTAKALTITIESAIEEGYELFDTAAPDVETASERRWRVKVPARGRAEFVRQERTPHQRYEELRRLDYRRLQEFMQRRWLDKAAIQQLETMLDNLGAVQRAKSQQAKLQSERDGIYKQQEQLRANLGALQPTGPEANLRGRVLAQLTETQDRLEAISRENNDLERQIINAEANVERIIARLGDGG
jgi:hypothetical protein